MEVSLTSLSTRDSMLKRSSFDKHNPIEEEDRVFKVGATAPDWT